jgi:site-specific DNA recombinase
VSRICLYARSSKDRQALSPAAQIAKLKEFVRSQPGWRVAMTLTDSEVGRSEASRPGLDEMLQAAKERKFDLVLVDEPSRLAGPVTLAVAIESRLESFGVAVQYVSIPQTGDPATMHLLRGLLREVSQYLSALSAQKGKASQVQLVQNKFKAGGRAPTGYRIVHEDSGLVRQGKNVMRSRWELSDEADAVREYLTLRSNNVNRTEALKKSGLKIQAPSAVALEKRAAIGIYSGTGVWNVRRKVRGTLDNPGRKMVARPEAEVLRVPDSHPPIIDAATAMKLSAVIASSARFGQKKQRAGGKARLKTLLGTILYDHATGKLYSVDGGERYYRSPSGKRFPTARIDAAVIGRIAKDCKKGDIITRLLDQAEQQRKRAGSDLPRLQKSLKVLDQKIARVVSAVEDGNASAALARRLEELETERAETESWLATAKATAAIEQKIRKKDWSAWFEFSFHPLPGETQTPAVLEELRDRLHTVVERVTLDETRGTFRVAYRLPGVRINVALPEGFEPSYQP